MSNMNGKNRIQALLINYLQKFGTIQITLPDQVNLEIGITQESKNGMIKDDNYCWVTTQRDDRKTVLDRYSMSMLYDDPHFVVDSKEQGSIYVV